MGSWGAACLAFSSSVVVDESESLLFAPTILATRAMAIVADASARNGRAGSGRPASPAEKDGGAGGLRFELAGCGGGGERLAAAGCAVESEGSGGCDRCPLDDATEEDGGIGALLNEGKTGEMIELESGPPLDGEGE